MMRLNPKAFAVVLFVLLAALLLAMPFQKRRARTALRGGGSATIAIPSFIGMLRGVPSTLTYENRIRERQTACLLHTFFEQPIMILPGPATGTALCVYDFDVGFRVIAFDGSATEARKSAELKVIVPKSDIAVRYATTDEIVFTAEQIRALPPDAFAALSLPTLDIGFVQVYAQQKNVVARVREALNRERNRIAAAPR